MKKFPTHLFKWLVPIFFIVLAIFFYTAIPGYSFSGLICLGIAGILTCYYLLGIFQKNHFMAAKVLRTVLSCILCVGIVIVVITGVVIIRAGAGEAETDCQYIVVLGAKVNGTSPSLSLSERIDAAYDYLTAHPESVAVVSGGKGANEGISEAQCMFNELTAMGIDENRIWMEDKATSTWENLNFSLDLIEAKTGVRPTSIGLISSEYHLFRAGLFAKDCGVTAVGIPAVTSWVSLRINYYLREVAGVWHYLILGGQYHD